MNESFGTIPRLVLSTVLIASFATVTVANEHPVKTVSIFAGDGIHFSPTRPDSFATDLVRTEDNGRVILRTVDLPSPPPGERIIAHLVINPIPKDEQSVHDKWDRAGNLSLASPGGPDLEVIKFITAYGGRTEYRVDVSHLAPLLQGAAPFRAFVDTWVSPAWLVDFGLEYHADSLERQSRWVLPVINESSYTRENYGDSGLSVRVDVPTGAGRALLHYFVSGHCTDGTDADEFVKKDNVISVDGVVVYRFQPWRDDCRRYREINPYTRRWSDGTWSSDYSRSGWCPGDYVRPLELDLTDHLPPGPHTIRFAIENVRPKDEAGHYGYWRVSAYVIGVDK